MSVEIVVHAKCRKPATYKGLDAKGKPIYYCRFCKVFLKAKSDV